MHTEKEKEFLKDKLERCKQRIHEIELTNDRKYREEWRQLKKLEYWIEHHVLYLKTNKNS